MSSKAQFFSSDFFLSFVLFMLMFAGFYFAWEYSNELIAHSYALRNIETRGVQASDVLVRTKGSPENWDSSNVNSLGIASSENIINHTLLSRLSSVEYNTSKFLIGLQAFDYYLLVEDFNSQQIFSYGLFPSTTAKTVIPVTRYVLYQNETSKTPARMRLIIWG